MKFLTTIFFILFTIANLASASTMESPDDSVRIEVVPSTVSTHELYRESENVTVQLSGLFPHSCYQPITTQVSQVENKILLTDTAMIKEEAICYMALKPHQKTVDIGKLNPGTYSLYINEGEHFKKAATINVE